jgi:membrane protease YdiL (CAAX protease family)
VCYGRDSCRGGRVTTILRAIGVGVMVLLAGSLPLGALRAWNFQNGIAVPWSIVPMALYLWAYWQFLGGEWGEPAAAARRRHDLRANPLSYRVWAASLGAGLIGFGALVSLLAFAARLVELPAASPIVTPPGMPFVTALSLIVMGSIVAGVTEEAAFRGYMQGPIERRYGLGLAILVNGLLFGLLHFPTHPADVLWMLPYYVAVSAVYGGLTWAANSILPALVLHAAGDVVVLIRWWLTGRPEWQIGATAPPLVWDAGVDAHFVLTGATSIALVAAAAGGYRMVRKLRTKPARGPFELRSLFNRTGQ